MSDVMDFLAAGGVPSCKFDNIGDSYEGVIVREEVRDQTDIETGVVQTWDDGTPKKMVTLDIQTSLNDPDIKGDDGMRRLYMKSAGLTALRTEWRRVGGIPLVGATIKVTYTGNGTPASRGRTPAKLFEVTITPGSGSALSPDDLA